MKWWDLIYRSNFTLQNIIRFRIRVIKLINQKIVNLELNILKNILTIKNNFKNVNLKLKQILKMEIKLNHRFCKSICALLTAAVNKACDGPNKGAVAFA